MTRLNWKGPAVLANVQRATVAAINEITEQAAEDADRDPNWVSQRRGSSAGPIANDPARIRRGRTISGRFGLTRRKGKPFDFFLERGTPFLRPAADRTFPKLAAAIRRRVR